jgi:hypothetical protein
VNRSLARSLLLGAVLLVGALLLRAACTPIGSWETAVVLRGDTPLRAVRGPALVWAVPLLEDTRVYDVRLETASGVVPWAVKGVGHVPTAKGLLGYVWTWRVTKPLLYAKLGSPAVARHKMANLIHQEVARHLGGLEPSRLLGRGDLRSELGGLVRRCGRDGIALLSLDADRFRWSSKTLSRYLSRRKSALAARLAATEKRDAAERALLLAREEGVRKNLLARARRAARLARARAEARALDEEILAARSAPSFFADLVRSEILARALERSQPAAVRASGADGPHTP